MGVVKMLKNYRYNDLLLSACFGRCKYKDSLLLCDKSKPVSTLTEQVNSWQWGDTGIAV